MMKKSLAIIFIFILLFLSVFTNFKKMGKNNEITLGMSFPDFGVYRWPVEMAVMTKIANNFGAQCISQVANHDADLQNKQIEHMINLGVDVLIIIAEDGEKAASAVEKAVKAGVPVVAYDRLIKSDKLSCYVSYDNKEIGREQAKSILKVKDNGRFVLLGGSPTDYNAVLFRIGQMEVLLPYIDKGQIKIIADEWVNNWDPSEALKIMERILYRLDNDIDAVVASNDGTALGALMALKAQGLAGIVPISGQDATAQGCKSIVEDELTVTIFKDVRDLSPKVIEVAIKLAKKQNISDIEYRELKDLVLDETIKGSIPCLFLPIVQVDKNNVYDVVVKSGFQDWEEVYRDIPLRKRPPRP